MPGIGHREPGTTGLYVVRVSVRGRAGRRACFSVWIADRAGNDQLCVPRASDHEREEELYSCSPLQRDAVHAAGVTCAARRARTAVGVAQPAVSLFASAQLSVAPAWGACALVGAGCLLPRAMGSVVSARSKVSAIAVDSGKPGAADDKYAPGLSQPSVIETLSEVQLDEFREVRASEPPRPLHVADAAGVLRLDADS